MRHILVILFLCHLFENIKIVFPKIQDRRNETPHDTLSAIKKHPYKGSSQNKVIRLGEAKRMQESFYSK